MILASRHDEIFVPLYDSRLAKIKRTLNSTLRLFIFSLSIWWKSDMGRKQKVTVVKFLMCIKMPVLYRFCSFYVICKKESEHKLYHFLLLYKFRFSMYHYKIFMKSLISYNIMQAYIIIFFLRLQKQTICNECKNIYYFRHIFKENFVKIYIFMNS